MSAQLGRAVGLRLLGVIAVAAACLATGGAAIDRADTAGSARGGGVAGGGGA